MKGLILASFLQELERCTGKNVFDIFDYFTGTSIGGILALIFAKGGPGANASSARDFFIKYGPLIFGSEAFLDPGGVRTYRYNPAQLEAALMTLLDTSTINTLAKPVFIPAFELYSYAPYFFFTGMAENRPAWMAGRATASAETYFPAFAMGDKLFWDGGTVQNNPALLGSIWAEKRWPGEKLCILSLGCGESKSIFTPEKLQNAGALEIGLELINACLVANDELPDLVLSHQRPEGYFRVKPAATNGLSLNGASPEALAALDAAAKLNIQQNSVILDAFINYVGL
jgi:patatin-like phospholipase/acyl hydrolase